MEQENKNVYSYFDRLHFDLCFLTRDTLLRTCKEVLVVYYLIAFLSGNLLIFSVIEVL